MQKGLDIARRFSANPTATNDKQHPYALHKLATNGYSGGELLRLPQEVGMMLTEDKAFESLFNTECGTGSPMQHGGIHPSRG